MNFIELDLGETSDKDNIRLKGVYQFPERPRENHAFVNEKRANAHSQCDQMLKSMNQMKQSKFIKDFKDLRFFAFDELVRNL
jgi:hypothetical protein